MAFIFKSPESLLTDIASRAKAMRLAAKLTRRTLALKSGVAEANIKRFETTGQISFQNLLKIAFALDCMDEFEQLFNERSPQSIDDLQTKTRQRGSL
ncbi:MAG: helix-turn-helix domain-containing protein [Thiolinea sp.]